MKKIITFIFVFVFALVLVGCGKEEASKADPTVPTAIAIKVKTAKVQINNKITLNYTITPTTAQTDNVTIVLNNSSCTYAKEGTNKVVITAGTEEGSVKVTITTSNGISASKTIKIQKEAVTSYPDLSGYKIKLAQAEHAMGEYDVKLTADTKDKYGYYEKSDRDAKLQAWDEVEDNYNCTIEVVPYPADAPWGTSRWQYILTQAQNETAEYDFYVVPNSTIPGFVAGNALVDLTDWYAEYGKNLMTDVSIIAGSYKKHLYAINENEVNIYNLLGYNIGLLKQLQEKDPSIKEPAQIFLDGDWDYDTFKEYCIKVQNALDTHFGTESKYYCLSGYGNYYWLGLVEGGGVQVLDTVGLKANLTGTVEQAAAQTMQEIYAAGCEDPSFQVDQGVATWNSGHALFNTGDFWFVNTTNRWNNTLWGEGTTQYGYVPFPRYPGNSAEQTFVGLTAEACIVMPTGREWAYEGYGADCTTENIYRAFMDYYITARNIYHNSEDYSYLSQLTATANQKFGSEASVQAYLKVMIGTLQEDGTYKGGIKEYGVFDIYVENSNGVVGSCGGTGTLAGSINSYIKGNFNDWIDAVGTFQQQVDNSLVDLFG